MMTPYDWQEGMGNRAQYVEGRLQQGIPVLAKSLDAGIVVVSRRRQSRKIYEIYDRIAFAGLGQPSDLEAIRTAALEFASREGFNRSEDDVNVQRVATAVSTPIRRSFGDFNSAPVVARCLFAEIGDSITSDRYYTIDYDGDFALSRHHASVAGSLELGVQFDNALSEIDPATDPAEAADRLGQYLVTVVPHAKDAASFPEAVLLLRTTDREDRFHWLTAPEA
jgi:proteasome alpha subunit